MPYEANTDLPEQVRKALTDDAQTTYREAFNTEVAKGTAELDATKVALEAVQKHWLTDSSGDYVSHVHVDARAANYRPATTMNKTCALCKHYDPDQECEVVAGSIRPDYVCDLYDASDTAARAATIDEATPILKVDTDRQLVFGWSSVAISKSGETIVDHHGDMIDQSDLEEAAYAFVLESREGNDMHVGETVMKLVESMAFTDEKLEALAKSYAKGESDETAAFTEAYAALQKYVPRGLWQGFYVEDTDIFKKVKDGERKMFSIEGIAFPEKADA